MLPHGKKKSAGGGRGPLIELYVGRLTVDLFPPRQSHARSNPPRRCRIRRRVIFGNASCLSGVGGRRGSWRMSWKPASCAFGGTLYRVRFGFASPKLGIPAGEKFALGESCTPRRLQSAKKQCLVVESSILFLVPYNYLELAVT